MQIGSGPKRSVQQLIGRHRLLAKLSVKDRRRIAAKMEVVSLGSDQMVYGPSGIIQDVFFPLSAVFFFSGMTSEGHVVEIGQIGHEGIAGVEVALRTRFSGKSLVTAAVQIPGLALRMNAESFAQEVDESPAMNRCVRQYMGFFLAQLQLLIACNRHHSLEQRGARWLLALQDRTGTSEYRLTQQHLADALGVARQSADRLMDQLQEVGIIISRRGILTICDRSKLLGRVCDCYHMIAERLEDMIAVSARS